MGHHNSDAQEELRSILFLNEQGHLKNQKEITLVKMGRVSRITQIKKRVLSG
jgi:hypothetical protein